MRLAEIRDLDGPNLFMLCPAIKIEIVLEDGETEEVIADRLASGSRNLSEAAGAFLEHICQATDQPIPAVTTRHMDDASHISVAFSWQRRAFALAAAQYLVDTITDVADDNYIGHIRQALQNRTADDRPALIRDADRSAIAISVTGTNGKTTTTRLTAHLMRTAGLTTGWNSSSGIYIEGEEIESGDYSGPSGARRVLTDPSLQAAVLETARGGILLRGLGYEHNDVSVFTNVSPDHLDLQGVRTLETLAEVKSVVCKVTRPGGLVVVNADDPLVMAATSAVTAPRFLVTQDPDNPAAHQHLGAGGRGAITHGDEIVVREGAVELAHFPLAEIPMTFDGRARHMVENAMCAICAALGAGLSVAQIRAGLHSFRNNAANNPGRLNVYRCGQFTVVLDFAHNEEGLKHLVAFGRGYLDDNGKLISIIGTAGDRTDQSLSEIGRIAAEHSGLVIAKGTHHYLRGRSYDSLMDRYREGAKSHPATPYLEAESEAAAVDLALDHAEAGDVIVMMMQEHIPELIARLEAMTA